MISISKNSDKSSLIWALVDELGYARSWDDFCYDPLPWGIVVNIIRNQDLNPWKWNTCRRSPQNTCWRSKKKLEADYLDSFSKSRMQIFDSYPFSVRFRYTMSQDGSSHPHHPIFSANLRSLLAGDHLIHMPRKVHHLRHGDLEARRRCHGVFCLAWHGNCI